MDFLLYPTWCNDTPSKSQLGDNFRMYSLLKSLPCHIYLYYLLFIFIYLSLLLYQSTHFDLHQTQCKQTDHGLVGISL